MCRLRLVLEVEEKAIHRIESIGMLKREECDSFCARFFDETTGWQQEKIQSNPIQFDSIRFDDKWMNEMNISKNVSGLNDEKWRWYFAAQSKLMRAEWINLWL